MRQIKRREDDTIKLQPVIGSKKLKTKFLLQHYNIAPVFQRVEPNQNPPILAAFYDYLLIDFVVSNPDAKHCAHDNKRGLVKVVALKKAQSINKFTKNVIYFFFYLSIATIKKFLKILITMLKHQC